MYVAEAVALEAVYQIWTDGWSDKITTLLDANGTRERWFKEFGNEIAAALEALDAARW